VTPVDQIAAAARAATEAHHRFAVGLQDNADALIAMAWCVLDDPRRPAADINPRCLIFGGVVALLLYLALLLAWRRI
jgi:hypothetical protein